AASFHPSKAAMATGERNTGRPSNSVTQPSLRVRVAFGPPTPRRAVVQGRHNLPEVCGDLRLVRVTILTFRRVGVRLFRSGHSPPEIRPGECCWLPHVRWPPHQPRQRVDTLSADQGAAYVRLAGPAPQIPRFLRADGRLHNADAHDEGHHVLFSTYY